MDTQPDSGRAFPPNTVSSSSTTNFGAQHLRRSSRLMAQHRQHPYIIPGRKQLTTPNVVPSTQLITSTLIPDLTGLITRCNPDPVSGGTYGNIYKCIYHGPEGDEEVAVKVIRPQYVSAEIFRRELGIWKRLRHSNILKLMGTTSDFGPSVALVAPWITNGTLTSFLDQNNETLGLCDRLLLLRDIAAGLNYLHTFSLVKDGHVDLNPVIHGDLTGTNVLIDGDRKAYLADFGLSGTFEKVTGMTYLAKMTCHPGAVRWAAPELLSGEESATTQSDMYSFGNIMLQVLTGNVPWCHLTRDFQITYQVVIQRKIHPRPHSVHVTDRHWNFMTYCWSMSFGDRPLAKEAVQLVDGALHSSTSPQSPTLSISSDEGYQGIASNEYVWGDTDTRLPVMQDIDSPLDAWEYYPEVMLPAYPSTTYTTSLEPSWTQSNLPRPHTSDFSATNLPRPHTSDFFATYHPSFSVEDEYNAIPSGYFLPQSVNYNNTMHHNWVNLNMQQNASLQYYMQPVKIEEARTRRGNETLYLCGDYGTIFDGERY